MSYGAVTGRGVARTSPVANDDARDWVAIRRAVARYVQHRAGRGDVADDIAQEVLARLMQLAETEQIGSIMALAFRIADNLLIDTYRRERRFDSDLDAEWQSDAPSPDRVLDSRAAMIVFQRCLRAMPPLRREVLVRRRLHQQGCREIADALSLTPKAVEKHITRGLADLRRAMTRAGVEIGELP
ncbi:sigma-70 family RNA polymerase sigma factor [Sphingomonas koreensis]|uniref:Sigma-70 family RNA polymerase sigma factor n=1 Tax=Sphingomonas koreensis TaxID=93064 RepID=A0A430CUT1_9SPHN|nr:sigma-70 family RNA polymerase sigma factor [Sphingomonas koreensis]RSU68700.1 sigma-70 family RNA polymerase sigma factor [Sphingomonas koreensis]RSY90477.1 sigma-70 family RNA polymerase sigma factor [Sphingomonas koreensis]